MRSLPPKLVGMTDKRSPIDNLDMNEAGIGGWGGGDDQSFHAWQHIMFYHDKAYE